MRAFSWVPLLGLLAALAAAQEQGVDVPTPAEAVVEEATHKTTNSSSSGILQAVKNLVASAVSPLTPTATANDEPNVEVAQLEANSNPVEVEDDRVTEGAVVPTNPSETEEASTVLTNRNKEEVPAENNNNNNNNNNNEKLVGVYNEVVDNVIDVLSSSLSKVGPLPIELSDDVKLTALDAAEATPEPEPEPEPTDTENGKTRKNIRKKKNKKNRKNKNKNKNKKNKRKGEVAEDEDSERKNNKKVKKNKNKNEGVNNEEEEVVEEEVNVRPGNKGNKKRNKNKNKNKNKRKNKRNNKKNKKNKAEAFELSRDGRAMSEDEDVEEESLDIGQARRQYPERKNKGNKKNKRKRKNKKNRKNNKNKKNDNRNSNAQGKESRADPGLVYPSPDELSSSNARITGFSTLSRVGDVTIENTAKALLVNAKVQVGPMFVQLANAARALTKSQVSTVLEADMQFKVRSKGRGRKLIKLNSVTMGGPSEITVARLDLPLEPEVVMAAQDEVLNALDVARVGRIFEQELEKIFEEDNVVQNLENHPFLKN